MPTDRGDDLAPNDGMMESSRHEGATLPSARSGWHVQGRVGRHDPMSEALEQIDMLRAERDRLAALLDLQRDANDRQAEVLRRLATALRTIDVEARQQGFDKVHAVAIAALDGPSRST